MLGCLQQPERVRFTFWALISVLGSNVSKIPYLQLQAARNWWVVYQLSILVEEYCLSYAEMRIVRVHELSWVGGVVM